MTEEQIEIVSPVVVATEPSDDVDIKRLLMRLWRRRWLAPLFVVLALGPAIIYLHSAQYKYLAELSVTPAEQGGSKIPGNLASLGSLVGVDIGSQATTAFGIFGYTVRAYPVAERLSQDPKIMRRVFYKEWDGTRWREPQSSLKPIVNSIKAFVGAPVMPWRQPTAVDLQVYLEKEVSVFEDKKKSLLTFSYENVDPQFARYLLLHAVVASDEFLRARSLARASTYVAYLESRLGQVQVAEYRQTLAQALSSYENTRMMASSKASFAAEQFGDVLISNRPTTPQPMVVIGIAAAVGFIAWILIVLLFLSDPTTAGSRQPTID
jgi:hypothetical protein